MKDSINFDDWNKSGLLFKLWILQKQAKDLTYRLQGKTQEQIKENEQVNKQ